MNEEHEKQFIEFLELEGYGRVRYVPNWGYCGLHQFIFTVGVCYGLDYTGLKGRFCFSTLNEALGFYETWTGKELPKVGVDGCTAIK